MMVSDRGWGTAEEEGRRKGPWTAEEDKLLIEYVRMQGGGKWNSVARLAGLKRNGKSCRLRWVNYLRPDLKRGRITPHEESIISELHARWGNRWSIIARSLPGRTDNEIKNYWRTHFKRKAKVPSDAAEKARTTLQMGQQFQQQQQALEQRKQEAHLQHDQFDMKELMALLDQENNHNMPSLFQMKQELPINDEQGYFYSMLNGNSFVQEAMNHNILWDELWNLDDIHGNFSLVCARNKAS